MCIWDSWQTEKKDHEKIQEFGGFTHVNPHINGNNASSCCSSSGGGGGGGGGGGEWQQKHGSSSMGARMGGKREWEEKEEEKKKLYTIRNHTFKAFNHKYRNS
jgi:hypothetical protein